MSKKTPVLKTRQGRKKHETMIEKENKGNVKAVKNKGKGMGKTSKPQKVHLEKVKKKSNDTLMLDVNARMMKMQVVHALYVAN